MRCSLNEQSPRTGWIDAGTHTSIPFSRPSVLLRTRLSAFPLYVQGCAGRQRPLGDNDMPDDPKKIIGRASATEKNANQSNEFNFWLAPDVLVNPFDIVEADTFRESKTYGLVMNLEHTTDAPSHLSNYISNNFGEAVEEPQTPRQGTTVARCAVLSNTNEIYMPVPS